MACFQARITFSYSSEYEPYLQGHDAQNVTNVSDVNSTVTDAKRCTRPFHHAHHPKGEGSGLR